MRLTEESEFGFIKEEPLKYAPTKPIFTKDDDSLFAVCDILNKLGQLEDIEEELGIDLIILFKVLKNDEVFKKINNIIYRFGELMLDFNAKCLVAFHNEEVDELLLFKDYGKTWALTREELE